jgi:hypothetical protein
MAAIPGYSAEGARHRPETHNDQLRRALLLLSCTISCFSEDSSVIPGISWPNGLLRRGRYRIEFALSLLDATGADMALYCNADMVRAIARTCTV